MKYILDIDIYNGGVDVESNTKVEIDTTVDKNTVRENLVRAEKIFSDRCWANYETYQEFYEDYGFQEGDIVPLTEKEFNLMKECFDLDSTRMFLMYVSKQYGFKITPFEQNIDFFVGLASNYEY